MKESKLLGTLLPSSPDFAPIITSIREKYNIPELSPDDDPIEEVFLDGEPVALEDFRQDIKFQVEGSEDLLPPELDKLVKAARPLTEPVKMVDAGGMPEVYVKAINDYYNMMRGIGGFLVNILDQYYSSIADMLYIYILTGETEEIPSDWISNVVTLPIFGETAVIAMASFAANPEVVVQQFRTEYAKVFGRYRPKISNMMVSTAYYIRLRRLGKSWEFTVEEYIRRNHLKIPRDRNSEKYFKAWNMYLSRLKKRITRYEKVLKILGRDKK